MAFVDKFDSSKKFVIESSEPEIGTKIGKITFGTGKYAIQSGPAQIGSYIGVNGGMNPTTVLPGGCGLDFWTSKQGFYHSFEWDDLYQDYKDHVVDSSIMLLHMSTSGTVVESIDLESVIFGIVKNIVSDRVDVNERVAVASEWINPYYYDRYTHWEPLLTTASPNYLDIPSSYAVQKVVFVGGPGGDVDDPDNYLRPCLWAGILGPVYAGVVASTDVTTKEPWMSMQGPCDPSNIAVRDIKLDANGNLWCLLQIGWQYSPVVSNEVRNTSYMGYEARIAVQYDDTYYYGSSADPTSYPVYDPGYFPRQYVPPHAGTYTEQVDRMYRCGLPRARMFLVCFNKSTNFKTWDYLPFIPGTVGFKGKYYIDSILRGPCRQTIASPPLKLDIDEFGNVYGCCGTWFGLDRFNSYPSYHWEGLSFAFNEYMYFYQRADGEMPVGYVKPSTGIDVGRIGPFTPGGYGQCTLWRYDLECTAYKGKTSGSNKTCRKSPWTYTIGGDRAVITASWDSPSTKIRKYWFTALGNRTISKCGIKIDTSATYPRPVLDTSGTSMNQMPWNARSWRSEWYNTSGSDSGRELVMEMDLMFAQCDMFTRNYYGVPGVGNVQPTLAIMQSFDPASWADYEETWRTTLNKPAQLHLDRAPFFQSGNYTGENPTGFNPAEAPTFFYPHTFSIGTAYYEMQAMARSGTGTVYYQRIPLYPGTDGGDYGYDQIIKPASTPYVPTAVGTDYFEKCSISGSFPTMLSREPNENTVVIPFYNFKYEMFTFSGLTWDSFSSLRALYPRTKSAVWPFRWHSMKKFIAVASDGGLYSPQYGARTSYIDPTVASPGDYTPVSGERVVRYTSGFYSAVETVRTASESGDAAAAQALALFNQYLASVKFTIYETLMQDINFGSFGSSVRCSNTVGMLTPMPLLDATYTHEDGDWTLDLTWDPYWGKRLYVITPETKTFDCTWQLVTTAVKKYWSKITDWMTSNVHVNQPVNKVTWYDFTNDQIAKLNGWVMDPTKDEYCVEKWQQLEFVNRYPDGKVVSPQLNLG